MSVETTEFKALKNNIKKTKRVKVSSKRQISVPKDFYDAIGLNEEVIIELFNNRLVIRPARPASEDFSEEILTDLVNEGYDGEALIKKFAERRAMMGPALDNIVEEARTSKSYDSFEEMLKDTENESDDE